MQRQRGIKRKVALVSTDKEVYELGTRGATKTIVAKKDPGARPGFDAFLGQKEFTNTRGKKVRITQVLEPETGIHSQAWALGTKPQPASGLLSIPVEVRTRIFTTLLRSYSTKLAPKQDGKKFKCKDTKWWGPSFTDNFIQACRSLSLVSRQMYVEVVGSALLHRLGDFSFNTPLLMDNYLSRVNPFHASSITTLHLRFCLSKLEPEVPSKMIQALTNLQPSLQHLSFEISVHKRMQCTIAVRGLNKRTLQEATCTRLASSKRWKELKGLRSFRIKFEGKDHYDNYFNKIDAADSRLVDLEEEIRRVVMRT